MNPEQYTTGDILEAMQKAGLIGTVYDFRQFLNHLPEPVSDDWQECGFNDFRPTDKRVKAVFIGGSIIEGTPDRRNGEHVFLVDGPVIHSYDDATFYRIPAPVIHPDPAEHPVITIKAINGEPIDAPGNAMFWGGHYRYGYDDMTIAEDITDWEPADIVPKKVSAHE